MAYIENRIENCVCGGRGKLHENEVGYFILCEFDPGCHTALAYKNKGRAVVEWNATQRQMDQLTRDSVCAFHKGTTYGQLMATRPTKPPAERYPKKKTKNAQEEAPKDKSDTEPLRCITCGMLIPPACKSKRYCSPECAAESQRLQKQGRDQRLRMEAAAKGPQIPCAICGTPFPALGKKRKYCSSVCSDEGMRRHKLEQNLRKAERRRNLRRQIEELEASISGKTTDH